MAYSRWSGFATIFKKQWGSHHSKSIASVWRTKSLLAHILSFMKRLQQPREHHQGQQAVKNLVNHFKRIKVLELSRVLSIVSAIFYSPGSWELQTQWFHRRCLHFSGASPILFHFFSIMCFFFLLFTLSFLLFSSFSLLFFFSCFSMLLLSFSSFLLFIHSTLFFPTSSLSTIHSFILFPLSLYSGLFSIFSIFSSLLFLLSPVRIGCCFNNLFSIPFLLSHCTFCLSYTSFFILGLSFFTCFLMHLIVIL